MVQFHPISAPSDTYQITFSDIPLPQGVPSRLTARKIRPAVTFADSLHRSTRVLDPDGHRNGSNVTSLANQIHDGPMPLPDLQILNSKRRELGPAQSAADKH